MNGDVELAATRISEGAVYLTKLTEKFVGNSDLEADPVRDITKNHEVTIEDALAANSIMHTRKL